MSEENTPVSDGSGQAGSAPAEVQTVSYDTHKKLLAQRKADQQKLQEVNAKLAEYEANQKAAEEQALKETNQWKEVAEKKESELTDAQNKLKHINDSIVRAEKVDAFEKVLGAKLADPSFANFINHENIVMDADGNIDSESVNAEVNAFRERFGDRLIVNTNIPTIPGGAPQQQKEKTLGDLSAAERKALRQQLVANQRG